MHRIRTLFQRRLNRLPTFYAALFSPHMHAPAIVGARQSKSDAIFPCPPPLAALQLIVFM